MTRCVGRGCNRIPEGRSFIDRRVTRAFSPALMKPGHQGRGGPVVDVVDRPDHAPRARGEEGGDEAAPGGDAFPAGRSRAAGREHHEVARDGRGDVGRAEPPQPLREVSINMPTFDGKPADTAAVRNAWA